MQLHVKLAQGSRVDQLSRVIARLHAAKAEVASLRHDGALVVITLRHDKDVPRIASTLRRVVDVLEVATVAERTSPAPRTTYVPYIRPVRSAI